MQKLRLPSFFLHTSTRPQPLSRGCQSVACASTPDDPNHPSGQLGKLSVVTTQEGGYSTVEPWFTTPTFMEFIQVLGGFQDSAAPKKGKACGGPGFQGVFKISTRMESLHNSKAPRRNFPQLLLPKKHPETGCAQKNLKPCPRHKQKWPIPTLECLPILLDPKILEMSPGAPTASGRWPAAAAASGRAGEAASRRRAYLRETGGRKGDLTRKNVGWMWHLCT